ncbi:hypothetical protein W97_06942 [Coniosporium apollinis CBS 100218]|uniref:Plus3 domain-containing protein n=1 Tax=Coniosporium apollinis (strain CBS 100218) TaxID=1168221 RepID=R7Z0L0_CONA1|nr:uncharacterized protein W97_06942 [Coniosporium apollinis CBS 100218]EON67574.1 hypothetical protein W97_06942 [Coniosporium apollinis CBS 100218]
MSESDSDRAPADESDDEVMYPLEGKYKSEKDKAEIMQMSEIRREEILAERAAEVERKAQDLHLRRLVQDRERHEAKNAEKKKRKAAAADLDDGQRKSSRQKTKASEPLEAYKRQREQKNASRRRQDDRKDRDRRSGSRDGRSDVDAEGESEVEWDDRPAPPVREEPPAELKDFERVRVGRSYFARVCFYPGFDEAISGCYCRVSVGINRETGRPTYRMARIKGFTVGKPYPMQGPNGKPFMTDQYVIAAHGPHEKEWPFVACSDSKFTEASLFKLDKLKRTLSAENMKPPTRTALFAKCDDINALINHQWSAAEIQTKIERQNKLMHLLPTKAPSSDNPNGLSKAQIQAQKLAELNRANRKANAEDIRKAQIAERRREQEARAAAAARRKAQMEEEARVKEQRLLAAPGRELDELFGSDISRTGTPANGGVGTPKKRSGTPANGGEKREKKTGIPTFRKRNMDDDVIASMDLGVDIEI